MGGVLTPKSCPNFLFWTLLCPSDPSVASQHVPPVTGYVHAPDPMHTHGYPMGSDGGKMIIKSIFQHRSGIVLGWSEWPKNAPKVPKKCFFWFYAALRDPGPPPGYPAEHQNRNLTLTPLFMDRMRARKGVGGLTWIIHKL